MADAPDLSTVPDDVVFGNPALMRLIDAVADAASSRAAKEHATALHSFYGIDAIPNGWFVDVLRALPLKTPRTKMLRSYARIHDPEARVLQHFADLGLPLPVLTELVLGRAVLRLWFARRDDARAAVVRAAILSWGIPEAYLEARLASLVGCQRHHRDAKEVAV